MRDLLLEYMDQVIDELSPYNEGIFGIKNKKVNEIDYPGIKYTDEKIKNICLQIKQFITKPYNINYEDAIDIFIFGHRLNLISQIERSFKKIRDPKNECNWDDVVQDRNVYASPYIDNFDYKILGLENFPEAKSKKTLLYILDNTDEQMYMSIKSGKIINYDFKNRYNIYPSIKPIINSIIDVYKDEIKDINDEKIKEIWNNI